MKKREEKIVNVQLLELFITGAPIAIGLISAVHKHGQRLGKIEAKLDLLFEDVRALEKYN